MTNSPEYNTNLANLAEQKNDRRLILKEIERNAIANFKGQLPELESAIGMLYMGDHFGWKILVLIHSKRTLRKYENILGIKIREQFPDEGPSAVRSKGYLLAKKIGNFWKAVSGDIKIDHKKDIE